MLVTGATGYIASHTIIELLKSGYDVIGIDNLENSKKSVISRITSLTNRSLLFRKLDIRDKDALTKLFQDYQINRVIHFAGYKAVGESVENPMLYYSNNLKGSINLFEVMQEHDVKNLVFSSSCTVYGNSKSNPVTEKSETCPVNP
ncbi:SDR family NAD(P)-dependent oxidoreductase, partial [Winogradskyella sp.]